MKTQFFFRFDIKYVKICVPNNVEPPFMKLKCTRKNVSKKCFILSVTYAKKRMNKIVFVTNNFDFYNLKKGSRKPLFMVARATM